MIIFYMTRQSDAQQALEWGTAGWLGASSFCLGVYTLPFHVPPAPPPPPSKGVLCFVPAAAVAAAAASAAEVAAAAGAAAGATAAGGATAGASGCAPRLVPEPVSLTSDNVH